MGIFLLKMLNFKKHIMKNILKVIQDNIIYKIYIKSTYFIMLILLFHFFYTNPYEFSDKMLSIFFLWPILLAINKWFREVIKEIKQIQNREKWKIVKDNFHAFNKSLWYYYGWMFYFIAAWMDKEVFINPWNEIIYIMIFCIIIMPIILYFHYKKKESWKK